MKTEKAKTFALTAFGFLCIAIAVQMFVEPATSQIGGDEIASFSIVQSGTYGTLGAVTKNGDVYTATFHSGDLSNWVFRNNVFGDVVNSSNSSFGETKQLFK